MKLKSMISSNGLYVLEPDPSDVEEAIKLAEVVMNFVLQRMPDEVKIKEG